MMIGYIKIITLLTFLAEKFETTTALVQENDGFGRITYYDKVSNSDVNILAWTDEVSRDIKILEYVFLNKVK